MAYTTDSSDLIGISSKLDKGNGNLNNSSIGQGKAVYAYPKQSPEQNPLRPAQVCPNQQKVFVSIKGVSLCYEAGLVMENVDLDVFRGEIFTLIGPSGSGKTTLLKALAGLEPVCKGAIVIGNRIVSQPGRLLPPSKRRIAMVFQDHALFPHMNVEQNILFPLKNGTNRVKITATKRIEIDEVVEELGLADLLGKFPHELSGGQRQRGSLARALLAAPEILLLDEPFASQDPELKVQLQLTVQRLIWKLGITTLMVTHDQSEALSLGDRMGVMWQGSLCQVGTPAQLYHEPKTKFIADFIGYGSFLNGNLTRAGIQFELGRIRNLRWADKPLQLKNGQPSRQIRVFLRPDAVTFKPSSRIRAFVAEKVFLGAVHLYKLTLTSGNTLMALKSSRYIYSEGEEVGISLDFSRALIFERESQSFSHRFH